ncbi:inverse autotransporter beta domain-containing protein, partial [Salmonella enterica subsp. enterica serovar Kentucky]|nr:inverse autotransporter beta domain-containing protein [Salmonella enterica subsp. enterica serovar Kentucky]
VSNVGIGQRWAQDGWLLGYNTFYDNLLDENLQRAGFGAEAWGILDGAALPVAIEPLQVIVIALVAMAIALLSTLYPSWRAAATQP